MAYFRLRESFTGTSEGGQANIHDLIIDGADLHADYLEGALIGEAYNTTITNVTVKNSTIVVNPADNALVLITDGGTMGGGLVGYANNCTIYNCEVNNTDVKTNSEMGVAALSGKGLYIGGLVGAATNGTCIEYSRVTGGKVSSHYGTAVGALGGFKVYAGGIAGDMEKGTKMIDCFSDTDVYGFAATYVGVAAGCDVYVGGLTARLNSDEGTQGCELKRCHFAGTMGSYQYNTLLLMIPVQVAKDIHRSGLAQRVDGEGAVTDCYFNHDRAIGPTKGTEADTLGSKATSSEYGPKDDEAYADRSFWESHGYDFSGTVNRGAEDGSTYEIEHTNKWVMYTYTDEVTGKTLTYPVHGESVAATLDFPGAGKAYLEPQNAEDGLSDTKADTENPYIFAVMGMHPGEGIYYDATKIGGIKLGIELNDGYRLAGWYKQPNVTAYRMTNVQHGYFERLFADESKKQAALTETNEHVAAEDNDLFAAKVQACVAFHNVNGEMINTSGDKQNDTTDSDWYDYNAALPNVVPKDKPASDTAMLIGWTTQAKDGKGYSAVTTTEIAKLKADGDFYTSGASIEKTMDLYPVYTDLVSNVNVLYEGHDENTPNARAGYGRANVSLKDGKPVLSITGANEGNLPDGVRFIGWYEKADNSDIWYRVSAEKEYTLENADLTVEHTYEARFEYRVDYYAAAGNYSDEDYHQSPWNKRYAQLWQGYNTDFVTDIAMPKDCEGTPDGWYVGKPTGIEDKNCIAATVPENQKITAPYAVHNHMKDFSNVYDMFVKTDFPGAGTITESGSPALMDSFTVEITENQNYNFLFWAAAVATNSWRRQSNDRQWKVNGNDVYLVEADHGIVAYMTANVIFHKKDGTALQTVQRRYEENVFLNDSASHTYTYPLYADEPIDTAGNSLNNPASEAFAYDLIAEDMKVTGYSFLGWIDKDALTADELAYVYDTDGDDYVCSSAEKAEPYLLKSDAKTVRAMPNIYPVYVKYDIKTATNVNFEIPGDVKKPKEPTYTLSENEKKVTVTAYDNVNVTDNAEDGQYSITSVTVSVNGGASVEIPADTITKNENTWVFDYDVKPGESYVFTANYKPHVIAFHKSDSEIKVVVRNYGETIGTSVVPDFTVNNSVFMGWTETKPSSGNYHALDYDEAKKLNPIDNAAVNGTIVTHSAELYPVYATWTITADSNISVTPTVTLDSADKTSVVLTAPNGNTEYEFKGWYTGAKKNDGTYSLDGAVKVSEELSLSVSGNNLFKNELYTAWYGKVGEDIFTVAYHDPSGNVIYERKLYKGQDEGVALINKEVIDKDDDTHKTIEVPLSTEPYSLIQNYLDSNQQFEQWTMYKDGAAQNYNTFCRTAIIPDETSAETLLNESNHVLDLYPVVWTVTLTDGGNNPVSENAVTYNRISFRRERPQLEVRLNQEYKDDKVNVKVEKTVGTNSASAQSGIDVQAGVYGEDTSQTPPKEIKKKGTGITDTNGIAAINLEDMTEKTEYKVVYHNQRGDATLSYSLFANKESASDDEQKTLLSIIEPDKADPKARLVLGDNQKFITWTVYKGTETVEYSETKKIMPQYNDPSADTLFNKDDTIKTLDLYPVVQTAVSADGKGNMLTGQATAVWNDEGDGIVITNSKNNPYNGEVTANVREINWKVDNGKIVYDYSKTVPGVKVSGYDYELGDIAATPETTDSNGQAKIDFSSVALTVKVVGIDWKADNNAGTVTINPAKTRYANGSTVEFIANPNEGYGFAGFYTVENNKLTQIDAAADGKYKYTLNGNATVYALIVKGTPAKDIADTLGSESGSGNEQIGGYENEKVNVKAIFDIGEDGNPKTSWEIKLKKDITDGLDISGVTTEPEGSPIIIDLNGHKITGEDGKAGDKDGKTGLTIGNNQDVTITGRGEIIGGSGADGEPGENGGNGGNGVEAGDGAKVKVDEKVVIKGGNGGKGGTSESDGTNPSDKGGDGGNGGDGVKGDLEENKGNIKGGDGGDGGDSNNTGDGVSGKGGDGGNGGNGGNGTTGTVNKNDGDITGGNGGDGGDSDADKGGSGNGGTGGSGGDGTTGPEPEPNNGNIKGGNGGNGGDSNNTGDGDSGNGGKGGNGGDGPQGGGKGGNGGDSNNKGGGDSGNGEPKGEDGNNGTISEDPVKPTPTPDVTPTPAPTVTPKPTSKPGNGGGGGGGAISYKVTFDAADNGKIASGKATISVAGGSKIDKDSVPAVTANSGYKFMGWSEDGKTVVDITAIAIKKATTFTAVYKTDEPEPTLNPNDKMDVSDKLNTAEHIKYINGYPDGSIRPDNNITMAEVAQIFYNLLIDKNVTAVSKFQDVPADAWYAKAVNTLASMNIIVGVDDDTFEPERNITRAEFTTIASGFTEMNSDSSNIFPDVTQDDWFYDYVVTAASYGWISGYPDGTFRPLRPITRAEVTVIVNCMLNRNADEKYIGDNINSVISFPDLTNEFWAYYNIMEAANAHDFTIENDAETWTELK